METDGTLGRCKRCKCSCLAEYCPKCSEKNKTLSSMKNTAEKLNHWEVVQEAISKNRQPRMHWQSILKMSLTRAVARFKAAGMTAEQTIKAIEFEHPDLTDEARRRLKIGVCARFGEAGTHISEFRKGVKN